MFPRGPQFSMGRSLAWVGSVSGLAYLRVFMDSF